MAYRLILLCLLASACNPSRPTKISLSLEIPDLFSPDVLTHHNDLGRTGAALAERTLTPDAVNVRLFGKRFVRTTDGQIFTQPLYLSGVSSAGGARNLVFVATGHGTVYAFDADDPAASSPVWTVSGGAPVPRGDVVGCSPENGVISTPTIDASTRTLFFVAHTKDVGGYAFRLYAVDAATGVPRPGSPLTLSATVPGTGAGSSGGQLTFDSRIEWNRAALLLSGGVVYIAFSGICPGTLFHGWVFAIDAATLTLRGAFADTASGKAGGIWQAGEGAASDGGGALLATGDGDYDGLTAFGDSVVRLRPSPGGLDLVDWFTPYDQAALDAGDLDLGSSGVMLLPGSGLGLQGGKAGKLYLLDGKQLGHHREGSDSQIAQSLQISTGEIMGTPVYWRSMSGARVYVWPSGDTLRSYPFDGRRLAAADAAGPSSGGESGGFLSLSADGERAGSGVLWATVGDESTGSGVLTAYDAGDVSRALYSSETLPARDRLAGVTKFMPPTVAAGKVFVPTLAGTLEVFGALAGPRPLPSPWAEADLGPGVAGWADFDDRKTLTLVGSGSSVDEMHIVYRSCAGECQLTTHLLSVDPGARGVLLLRDGLGDARQSEMLLVGADGAELVERALSGQALSSSRMSGIVPPIWLRVSRRGGSVTTGISQDGTIWRTVSAHPFDAGPLVVGLGTLSGDSAALGAARFQGEPAIR